MSRYTRFPPPAPAGVPGATGPDDGAPDTAPDSAPGRAGRVPGRVAPMDAARRLNPLVPALMIALVLPIFFNLGPLRLSPNRLVLAVALFPALILWASGRAGPVRASDGFALFFCFWLSLSYLVTGGAANLELVGISCIEVLAPYFMARVFIRSEADFAGLLRILFWIVVILAPLACFEAVTGRAPLLALLDTVFTTPPAANTDPRLGLTRAQTAFEHPILSGIFAGMLFAPIRSLARAQGRSETTALLFAAPAAAVTFFSLSAGAWLGLMAQCGLIAWGLVFRNVPRRWHILGALVAAGYVFIDLASNRSAPQVLMSLLAFDAHTAYWRVLIFDFGMDNVWAHPLVGLGMGDWARPEWMASRSVDNFWLVNAMKFGIPGFIGIVGIYFAALVTMCRARPTSPGARLMREALVFALIGLGLQIATVHLWNATYVFAMFMLGAGAWLADAPQEQAGDVSPAPGRSGGAAASRPSGRSPRPAAPPKAARA
ncbi:O-antigen ligase family protein [Frigidibacter oleivorans]|uniref:O-antigen ligase family protein n=1 Tax=Frigidibacter oleivorans TaxID=2487129 RepID=UPI000F8D5C77|nr:O-antigen ligase family protein [Frigidibacter oleivorans]